VDNSAVKFSLKKSQVNNNCIKSEHLGKKTFRQETTSAALNLVKLYTLLFVLYIHEKQDNKNQKDQLLYSHGHYTIETTCFKCIAQPFNEI